MYTIRLVQCVSWAFDTQESKKARKKERKKERKKGKKKERKTEC